MDRLSDYRFMANYFRLYLHAAAMNLLVRLRRFIAEPLPFRPGQRFHRHTRLVDRKTGLARLAGRRNRLGLVCQGR